MGRQQLTAQLIYRIAIAYLLIAAVTTSYQFHDEQEHLEEDVQESLQHIEAVFSNALTTAIWQYDGEQLQSEVEGIVSSPQIEGVMILSPDPVAPSILFYQGTVERKYESLNVSDAYVEQLADRPLMVQRNLIAHTFTLYDRRRTTEPLAEVSIYASRDRLQEALQEKLLDILVAASLKVGLLLMLFYFFATRVVTQPLQTLMARVTALHQQEGEEIARLKPLLVNASDAVELAELKRALNMLVESRIHEERQKAIIDEYQYSLEEKIAQRTQELEQANRAKDDFMATMSHELRTPLTSIIGNSEMLSEHDLDPESLNLIHAIEVAGKSQLALVNDILDMSKIESGKFEIDEAPFDLCALISDVRYIFTERAQDVGLRFEIRHLGKPAHQLIGDGRRLGQVLINLLGNAMKFTNEGSVVMTLWVAEQQLHISIEDTGIGMSAEVQQQLFQRFQQADSSISRRFGGSGLGLFISYNLVQMMGGTIEVESEEGKGSHFLIRLPYRPSDLLAHSNCGYSTDPGSVLNQRFDGRVLVAEDTPELQILERRILEGVGVAVEVAQQGREAVDLALQQPFDLILMDMQMPVMDGIEATRTLRERGYQGAIVALTANVMQKHRDQFSEAGCDGFLAKPIDQQQLREVLQQWVPLAAPVAVSEQPQGALAEEEVDDELLAVFQQSTARNREQLMEHLGQRDWEQLRTVAHTVKGAAASFGFPRLSELGASVCSAVDEEDYETAMKTAMDLMLEMGRVLP